MKQGSEQPRLEAERDIAIEKLRGDESLSFFGARKKYLENNQTYDQQDSLISCEDL